jgi:hypothetical protein
MRKILKSFFVLSLFCLIFFLSEKKVRSVDYATDYQNYVNKGGVYQAAYGDYVRARLNYLSSQSLESKDKAMKATITMLQARDALTTSYLLAIATKVQTTKGIASGDQSSEVSQLNSEISWYNLHSSKIPSAGSLEDLVSDSNEAKAEYNNLTLNVIYQSLLTLGIGNNNFVRGELTSEVNILEAKISEIKANQDKDVSSIERSIVDVKNKLERSAAKNSSAKDTINTIKPTDQQKDTTFQSAQALLLDSNSYLKEANEQLLQIITQIKSAN